MVKYSTYDINTLYCGSTKQSPKVGIQNLYVKHLTIWLSHPVNAQSNPLLEISTHMTKIQIKTYTDTYAKPLSLWKGILQHSLFVNIVITFHLGVCYLDQYGWVMAPGVYTLNLLWLYLIGRVWKNQGAKSKHGKLLSRFQVISYWNEFWVHHMSAYFKH